MSLTVEVNGLGATVVDTANPSSQPVNLKSSTAVTVYSRKYLACADSATTTIQFDGISAKIIAIRTTGALTLKLNGEGTGHVVNGNFLTIDPAASYTSGTLTNASGGALNADVLLAG